MNHVSQVLTMDDSYLALPEPTPAPQPRSPSTCLLIALVFAALVIASLAIVVMAGGDRFLRAIEILRGGPTVTTVQVTPGEILPVLKLVVEEMNTTVHTTRTGRVLGGVADSLPRHIIAQGTVTACFDLGEDASGLETVIDPQDPQHVTVRMPAPEYCHVGIDHAEYFDEMGLSIPAGNDVNSLLLEDAKKQLYTAADAQDLLNKAKTRGADQIQVLLYKLGFKRVDVEFNPAAPIQ